MAGGSVPGPAGRCNQAIDSGTLCRQQSPSPGAVGAQQTPLKIKGPILVGEAARKPGFNFDGTKAEDMEFGDRPTRSASITTDPVFQQTDAQLNEGMRILMESVSIGSMETVALEMHQRFAEGRGQPYSSPVLDAEVQLNSAFYQVFHPKFAGQLNAALKRCNYDPTRITKITMDLLSFDSFWDKVSGLGITVHQVWSTKAEIVNYSVGRWFWSCDVHYTFYDHFGLDWADIVKNGERHTPQWNTGNFFKAWYILQHYRTAAPFITVMNARGATGGIVGW